MNRDLPPVDCCDAVVCLSHLRWAFVFQRPQHLMSRLARAVPVLYVEEPEYVDDDVPPSMRMIEADGVRVATPVLPASLDDTGRIDAQRVLLDALLGREGVERPLLWYYTPMALAFSDHLSGAATVYDCMDELSAFLGAPASLRALEARLLARADVVFTGGQALYDAKRDRHPNVQAFPSSVDAAHFRRAREARPEPADQRGIPHPRLGFHGVIDERLDLALIDAIARARPDWQLVMVGPTAKIDPATLPRHPNLHWLGARGYAQLPAYLSGWDLALMPFAINEATRYISPTKTPEYLAAGRPVVSSPITDVVRDWGARGLVAIADGADGFVAEIDAILGRPGRDDWLRQVDAALASLSWDRTLAAMMAHVSRAAAHRAALAAPRPSARLAALAPRPFDYLIVGAGFSGAVLAERLAAGANRKVLVVERRPHIGGNAYDCWDDAGILVHRYGPHIFHTNSQKVVDYLSRFTAWRPYEHRVLAWVDGRLLPIPINLTTINRLYGLSLDADGMRAFLAARAAPPPVIRSARDVVMASVGEDLYRRFFEGYTRKQWGVDPSRLDKSVTARIPTRTDTDDRYFGDRFQAMPKHGYTRMFENLLDHPNIKVMLNTDYREVAAKIPFDRMIYTGPIDEYFDHRYGPLPYRSLQFRHVTIDREWFQPRAVINYPSPDVPYTRVTEYKHLTGQQHPRTSITFEVPSAEGDPYYPIPTPENAALYRRYEALAERTPGVWFTGRLASYKYYNMDQVVAQSLALYERLITEDPDRLTPALVVARANGTTDRKIAHG